MTLFRNYRQQHADKLITGHCSIQLETRQLLEFFWSSYWQIHQNPDFSKGQPRVSACSQAGGSRPYSSPAAAHKCHLNDEKHTAEYTLLNYVILFVKLHQKI